jgi:hypothetical protein
MSSTLRTYEGSRGEMRTLPVVTNERYNGAWCLASFHDVVILWIFPNNLQQ